MRALVCSTLVALGLFVTTPARAHLAEGTIALTVAEAVPAPPVTPPAAAGGLATIELADDLTIQYEVTVHDLTGPALLAHIHEAPAGMAGPIRFAFTRIDGTTFRGETEALTPDQVATLLGGGYYVNVHTGSNGDGEIRGQITGLEIAHGTCDCRMLARRPFLKCVKNEIKKLDQSTKKSAAAKALKKAAMKSSCGLTQKKKTVACCIAVASLGESLPDIITGKLCAPVKKEAQCTKLGGTFLGATSSCFPSNPCSPPASPSGAFIDDAY